MQAKSSLVPVDCSPTSEAALQAAVTIARATQGKLLVIYVREPHIPPIDDNEFLYAIPEDDHAALQERLQAYSQQAAAVPYEYRLLDGPIAETIVEVAATEKVDLLVIGTHGRRGISRLLMGSVAETVMREVKCPVMAVKAGTPA